MKIIELTETQFKNYSKLHSSRNYFQTIEYASMYPNYQKSYLGFMNEESNTLMAATLLLTKNIGKFSLGYAPGGFLVDYENDSLFKDFTIALKAYLKEKKYVYLSMKCRGIYKIFDKDKNILYFDTNIIKMLDELGYIKTNKNKYYEAIIETEKTANETYQNFNSNTKRNIKSSSQKAITIYKESLSNISLLLERSTEEIDKIKKIANAFTTENNTAELYIAKLNPEQYINNYRFLLKEEDERNDKLNAIMQNINIKKTISTINKKMVSDKLITKYNNEIIKATNLYSRYSKEVIVGSLLVVKNNREIYFLNESHNKEFEKFYSSHLIKWEIIKKYLNEGYKIFNLGSIDNIDKKSGTYNFKMGFGGKVYEYVGDYDLIINKWLYKIIKILNKIIK